MIGLLLDAPLSATTPVSRAPLGRSVELANRSWNLASARLHAILRLLGQSGPVSVADIAQRFGVSYATARRDVIVLAVTGRAVRKHGRLLPAQSFRGEQHFQARAAVQASAKAHIAQKAAQILPHEGSIFIDAGTTCLEVGRLLAARPKLRLVTNSIPLIELANTAQATIVGIGGEVRKMSLALTGALTQSWMGNLHFDAAVVGASGLDLANGAYTSEINEAAIKAEALRRSTLRVLAADAEKWNRPIAVHFAPWSAFTFFVTNQDLPRDSRQSLATNHVALHLAG